MARAIDIVRRVAPRARENYLAAFEAGDGLLKQHGITTPLRLAHFLAQVLHETGGLRIERESGSYSAKRLMQIFGVGKHSARITWLEAQRLQRKPYDIFERVYGLGNPRKAQELGNTESGDGYLFRGNGIMQTTGRANHRRMGQRCGVDFEASPELVTSAEHALKPALAEWTEGNLNAAADADDIRRITRKINGGYNGLADRRRWFAKLRRLIKAVEFAPGAPAPGHGPPSDKPRPDDLAARLVGAMERKGYRVDCGAGELNIICVEGMDPDGAPNLNRPNRFNDARFVLAFRDGVPEIVGRWASTTEPGRAYTINPIHKKKGAARIELGQHSVWIVGKHRGHHEGLVQRAGPIPVRRDKNKDYRRDGDKLETGWPGINVHGGYNAPLHDIRKSSAGCLVIPRMDDHAAFMRLVKTDPRYRADRKFVFTIAVLEAADVVAAVAAPEPASPPATASKPEEAIAVGAGGGAVAIGAAAVATAPDHTSVFIIACVVAALVAALSVWWFFIRKR